MKKKRTRQEIARSFHVRQADIATLFECGRVTAVQTFDKAQQLDLKELGDNYIDKNKVRLTSVLRVFGITNEELLDKTAE